MRGGRAAARACLCMGGEGVRARVGALLRPVAVFLGRGGGGARVLLRRRRRRRRGFFVLRRCGNASCTQHAQHKHTRPAHLFKPSANQVFIVALMLAVIVNGERRRG